MPCANRLTASPSSLQMVVGKGEGVCTPAAGSSNEQRQLAAGGGGERRAHRFQHAASAATATSSRSRAAAIASRLSPPRGCPGLSADRGGPSIADSAATDQASRGGRWRGCGPGPRAGVLPPAVARKRRLLHVRCDRTRNEVIQPRRGWPTGLGSKPRRRPQPARRTVRGRLCMV